jgi:hypothetical protein
MVLPDTNKGLRLELAKAADISGHTGLLLLFFGGGKSFSKYNFYINLICWIQVGSFAISASKNERGRETNTGTAWGC